MTDPFEALCERDLLKMRDELNQASSLTQLRATIHEWFESAALAKSGIFEDAMAEPSDERPLPNPRGVTWVNAARIGEV